MKDRTHAEILAGIAAEVVAKYRDNECRHCGRAIQYDVTDGWVDPNATGDDSIWRETCDSHDTFEADHEPRDDNPAHLTDKGRPSARTKDKDPRETR